MMKRIVRVFLILFVILMFSFGLYVSDYNHADKSALDALQSNDKVKVQERNGMITFTPESDTKIGLIFYPGGKVEYKAYAPLLQKYAEQGIFSVVCKMPFNLALLDMNKASSVIDEYPEIEEWYLAGHSLGGVCASMYAGKNAEEVKGLILLAAYSSVDLSATDLKVIRIRGTLDTVLDLEAYEESNVNYPENALEFTIEGGNHAMFGNYGEQKNDTPGKITDDEQQNETVMITLENME